MWSSDPVPLIAPSGGAGARRLFGQRVTGVNLFGSAATDERDEDDANEQDRHDNLGQQQTDEVEHHQADHQDRHQGDRQVFD